MTNDISDAVRPLGDGVVVGGGLLGLYGIGLASENARLQTASLVGLESPALSEIVIQAGKYAVHRWRPGQSAAAYRFDGPTLKSNGHLSFPSGETGVAFSVASALAHEYDEVPYLAPAAYVLATLVALERINLNAHFASDVFFSGTIGFFTGKFLAERHPALPGGGEIVPLSVARSSGLALSWRF